MDKTQTKPNLSADIFCNATEKNWTASISKHPPEGGKGVEVWRKENMRSSHNAEVAMEAAWKRLNQ